MKLFAHQIDGVRKAVSVLERTGGIYLAWDPGMGKTLGFIATARILDVRRILVLAPVVALGVWDNEDPENLGEIQKWWPQAKALILRDGNWAFLQSKTSSAGPVFYLTNYDQLTGTDRKDPQTGKVTRVGWGKRRLKLLLKQSFDMLILDEAHYAKDPTSQRTRAVMRLAQKIPYKLLGSGTPSHSPLDWWAQFRIIAPHEPMWAQSFGAYKRTVAFLGGPTGNWIQGFNPVAKAAAAMAIKPYTHVAKVSILHLPEPIFTPILVELSVQERAAYQQMENLLFVEIRNVEVMTARIVLTKCLRLYQITAGHLEEHGIGSSKLKAALELLEQRAMQKVVVAASYDWELDAIEEALRKTRRPYLVIRGKTPQEDRKPVEGRFQQENTPFVMLLNYRAGGMALTLTRTDALILYSLTTSLISYQQMIGRVYRIGTTTHVQVLPLLARDTADEDIYAGLRRKAEEEDMAKLITEGIKRRAT